MMDSIEFYFNDTNDKSEVVRKYEVPTFDDAVMKFHEEFPDEETRPKLFRVRVEHLQEKVV